MSENPPVIGFELGVGEFRIVTPEAIYHIKVLPELITANTKLGVISSQAPQASPAAVVSNVPAPEPDPTQSQAASADHNFFQEISQELFDSVGQLARQLSVSVTELPSVAPGADLSKTGADLEDAKGQLEEVVELTEKASMTIMDLADQIQADMNDLNSQMTSLNNLESLLGGPGEPQGGEAQGGPMAQGSGGGKVSLSPEFMDKFNQIQAFIDNFGSQPDEVVDIQPAAPEAEPESLEPQSVVVFDLDVVFQTLYEFCTNESVKAHIKAMRDGNEEGQFKTQLIEQELSLQSASLEPDDGFYNFPIPGLLRLLYANTSVEDFKATLKKMNQTVESIFLENNLPVEGKEEIIAPAPKQPQAEAIAPGVISPVPAPTFDDMRQLGELFHELEGLLPVGAEAGEGAGEALEGAPEGHGSPGPGYAAIPIADRDTIIQTISSSEALIKNTSTHLTHIMEALSFQDLSGQRIKKIVNLISEIQVQLLTLLVSVNSKIKAHHETPTVVRPKEEREKVAQAEVDKMLEKLSAEPSDLKGPGAENRLDQGAVNDLLAQLGF
ncbi:MAG: protein phosphatase CheZ [Deltaproteobacteria bacterium]|jgi:chemotaxis regulatin CheY-phosphate phosphatase CheZ|nr:protein phosphatase CheZ [Deltaproteobacteria bacterium]